MGYDFGLEGRKTRRKGCNDEDFFVQGYDFPISFQGRNSTNRSGALQEPEP
jgi:hypothetical protein